MKENNIEWISGHDTMTATLSQKRFVNRVRKMAEKHPKLVEIVAENADGSIVAHIHLSALHLTIYGQKNGEVCDENDTENC